MPFRDVDALRDTLATMTHELRAPAAGIVGMAQLLADTQLSVEQRQCVDSIRTTAETLIELVSDLLELSRLGVQRVSLSVEPVDLDLLLETALDVVYPMAEAKGLALRAQLGDGLPPTVMGDRFRLQQILVNYLSNAVKFTAKGSVIVRASVEGADAHSALLRFEVADTGPGIGDTSRLFERFSQAHEGRGQHHRSSGLGLAICRELASLMSGDTGVRTAVGQGSTFWFTARVGLDTTHAAPLAPNLLPERCLVVGFSDDLTDDLQNHLSSFGVTSLFAPDPLAAIRACADEEQAGRPVRMLLCPLSMRLVDGIKLVRSVRALSDENATRAVIVAANPNEANRIREESAGVALPLVAPIRRSKLLTLVRMLARQDCGSPRDTGDGSDAADSSPSSRQRALVVEDSPIGQRVAEAMLTRLGFDVALAAHGRQATDMFAEGRYDIVLTDFELPDMNGAEVARLIRGMGRRGASVPIFGVTADDSVATHDLCLSSGMTDVLVKPLSLELLRGAVASDELVK